MLFQIEIFLWSDYIVSIISVLFDLVILVLKPSIKLSSVYFRVQCLIYID